MLCMDSGVAAVEPLLAAENVGVVQLLGVTVPLLVGEGVGEGV